jgi:hypothetical protein
MPQKLPQKLLQKMLLSICGAMQLSASSRRSSRVFIVGVDAADGGKPAPLR